MNPNQIFHISADGTLSPLAHLKDALAARTRGGYLWFDLENPARQDLEDLMAPFGLHPLAVEDCLNEDQVPKIEDFASHTFILFNRYQFCDHHLAIKEVDFFLGKDFLISVGELAGNPKARQRFNDALRIEGVNLGHGPDHLLHSLLDNIVDDKLVAIESLQDDLDELEEGVITTPSSFQPVDALRLRRHLLTLRKSLFHEREVLMKICRRDSPFISATAIYHFRDIYDHLVRFVEAVELCRELVANVMEVYLSVVNNELGKIGNRTNQVMRRLTFINTIFMPLTLIAGIGGMSEWTMITGQANWRIAYAALLALMTAVGMLSYLLLRRFDAQSRNNKPGVPAQP